MPVLVYLRQSIRARSARAVAIAVLALAIALVAAPRAAFAEVPFTTIIGVPDGWSSSDVSVSFITDMEGDPLVSTLYNVEGGGGGTYEGSPITFSAEGTTSLFYWSQWIDCHSDFESPRIAMIRIDKHAPVTSIIASDQVVPGEAFDFSLSASDTCSGIAQTRYRVNGGPETVYAGGSVTATAGATTWIDYWSIDAAGNVETPRTAVLSVATGLPRTTISGVPVLWSALDVIFSLAAASSEHTITATTFQVDGGAATPYTVPVTISAEGITTITYFSTDDVGQVEPTHTTEVRIDKTAPTSTLDGIPVGWSSSDVIFSITAADAGSGIAEIRYQLNGGTELRYSAPVTVSTPGTMTVAWWAVDNAGNAEAHREKLVRIDAGPVTTALGLGEGWTALDVSLTLSASSPHYPVDATYYRIGTGADTTYTGSPIDISVQGTTRVTYWSVSAGGVETPRVAEVRVDRGAPVSHMGGIPSGTSPGPVTFSIQATDAISGVAATYYTLNGGAAVAYTAPVKLTGEGVSNLTWWSVDEAGNAEEPQTAQFKIDRTPPVTVAGGVPAGWTASNVSVALSASSASYVVAQTYYRIGGGPELPYTAPIQIAAEGATELKYHSVDDKGQTEAEHSVQVLIDRTPASSSATLPAGWSKSDVTFVPDATDAGSGVKEIRYVLAAGPPLLPVPNPTVSGVAYSSPVVVSAEGAGSVVWWAIDNAGNVEATHSSPISIDKTAPVSIVSGIPSSPATHPVEFTLSASDPLSGVASVRYQVNGGEPQEYASPVSISSTGTTVLTYWAVDGAGNAETPRTASFTITSQPPGPKPSQISIKTTATAARIGGSFVLSGVVTAGTVGTNMHADVKKPGKTYWTYSSARTIYSDKGKAAWWYRYVLKKGMTKGVYQFRATFDANPSFLRSVSPTVKVSVR